MNRLVGTNGTAVIMPFGISKITTHGGERLLETKYEGDAYVQEHIDLVDSIRRGQPIVEAEELAASSLTAVMGRLAAYTGERVDWDFLASKSKLGLMPEILTLNAKIVSPGMAKPGTIKLV